LGSFLGIPSFGDWIKKAGADPGDPQLRRFTLDIQNDGAGLHVSGRKIDIQISLNIASTAGDHTVAIENGMILSSDATQTSKPGDIWQVRAPSFAFRATGFFANSNNLRPHRRRCKCSDPNSIYSTPMHITKDIKVTSDVTITIQRLAGEEDPTMWSLEPVFKSVPKALWVPCRFPLPSL
jgi:hypothetical protein